MWEVWLVCERFGWCVRGLVGLCERFGWYVRGLVDLCESLNFCERFG